MTLSSTAPIINCIFFKKAKSFETLPNTRLEAKYYFNRFRCHPDEKCVYTLWNPPSPSPSLTRSLSSLLLFPFNKFTSHLTSKFQRINIKYFTLFLPRGVPYHGTHLYIIFIIPEKKQKKNCNHLAFGKPKT